MPTHDAVADPNVAISFARSGKTQNATVKLESLPTEVPDKLPPAHKQQAAVGERPAVGLVEIKLPEIANECFAYVPENYHGSRSYGLIISLHAPGAFDKAKLEPRWRDLCQQYDLIVLAPAAAKEDGWQPTEAEFVRKAIDEVAQ